MREHAITATTRTLVPPASAARQVAPTSLPRRIVRSLASTTALAAGVLYVLIATGTLQVIDPAVRAKEAPIFIPIAAAAAFILGSILIDRFDRRIVQVLGIGVQLVTIVGYIAVAPDRTPSYEVWGIVIKALQVLTLVALVYLAVRSPRRPPAE